MMTPGRSTELFFLDEATALAAGHRPCFECRRPDATMVDLDGDARLIDDGRLRRWTPGGCTPTLHPTAIGGQT